MLIFSAPTIELAPKTRYEDVEYSAFLKKARQFFAGLCLTLGSVLACALAAQSAHAVVIMSDPTCLATVFQSMGFRTGERGTVGSEIYKNARSVLFLADGISRDNPEDFALGPVVAKKFPNLRVVSGDRNYRGPSGWGNLIKLDLDNTKAFDDFPDDSFSVVVMRKGLCICKNARCCGGFYPDSLEAKNFFNEVVRVLDKRSGSSRVILHGNIRVTKDVVQVWTNFLEEVEKKYGVQAIIHQERGWFSAIEIRPNVAPQQPRPEH